jgi:hypothetical protein
MALSNIIEKKNKIVFSMSEETLDYLLEKLDFIKLAPQNILLIGDAGLKIRMIEAIKAIYPEAECDFLSQHIRDYPLKSDYYDLILSHWLQPVDLLPDDLADNIVSTYELLFYLFQHFLKPNGLLLFSHLGPETNLAGLSPGALAALTVPMPALGDVLLKLDYQDPVLDRDCFKDERGCLELAYGHAWKKPDMACCFSKADESGSIFMPLSQIRHLETVD